MEVTDKPVDEALREAMPKIMKYVGGTNDKGEHPRGTCVSSCHPWKHQGVAVDPVPAYSNVMCREFMAGSFAIRPL